MTWDNHIVPYDSGDISLPRITWNDGLGQVNSNPAYFLEVNHLLIDTLNENYLEQLITQPTHRNGILDLLFCTCPAFISNTQVVLGISDHKAITFTYNCQCSFPLDAYIWSLYTVPLYHKADINKLKAIVLDFQEQFLNSSPYSQDIETNWKAFKQAITDAVNESIPKKFVSPKTNYPGSLTP